MGKKINIEIEEFLDKMPELIITPEDLNYIFIDKESRNQFKRLYLMYIKKEYDISILEDFLIDNADKLDKENLALILAKNCTYQLEAIEEEKSRLESQKVKNEEENRVRIVTLNEIKKIKKTIENTFKEIARVGKGLDKILTFYYGDDDTRQFELRIADSREIIDKKYMGSSKNLKRFEKIDNAFKDNESEDNIGIGYILQVIYPSDLKEVFPIQEEIYGNEEEQDIKKFGLDIIRLIYDRKILKEKNISYEELKKMQQEESITYTTLIEEMEEDDFTPYIKDALKEYIRYVDIDKLLLIAAYRFNYGLEMIEDKENTQGYEAIIKVILDNIENKHAKLSCKLEYNLDGKRVEKPVEYSVKGLERFAEKFVDNQYISEKEIAKYKNGIKTAKINLEDIDQRYIDIIFNEKDLEEYASLGIQNLKYVSNKFGWDKDRILQLINIQETCSSELLRGLIENPEIQAQDIINLYLNEKITKKQIEEIEDLINLSETINSNELIQYYKNSNEEDKENQRVFNRYLDLYKELLIDGMEGENLEESYNILVNSLLDNYNGEEYIKVAKDFYFKGLLPIEILAEWNGEKIIDRFYNDGIISLAEIEELAKTKKVSFEYISNIYIQLANKDDIEYDKRLEYINTGYITENEIFKMYEQNLIFEKDLEKLADQGIIRKERLQKTIDNRTKEDLEKNSHIRLIGLDMLTKRKNDIYSDVSNKPTGYQIQEKKDSKFIIDPNERLEFIRLFRAHRAETDLDEESPFYNYEFYVIPDESGEIGLNSVVIAERYYEDKDTEEKFALNNATYFFKYKDLMVLSNLKKSEMTKERKNIVFTANHTLATQEKSGRWAASVIYSISKTMLSDDLKEYNKEEQRRKVLDKINEVYDSEEIVAILDMASKIDSGEYTYEIINTEDKGLKKTVKLDSKQNKYISDEESR